MSTVQRPEITIKVYPENLVSDNKLQILKKLKTTNALILNLTEQLPKNKPFPFITIKRISSSEQLPKNLKLERSFDEIFIVFLYCCTYIKSFIAYVYSR